MSATAWTAPDPRAQQVGVLFFYEGLSLLEIACYLRLSQGEVLRCLVRCLSEQSAQRKNCR